MSNLLTSLLSSTSSRQTDEHGVADLLEAVSQRTMSCTDEEKKEISNMVKRVREHNHKPNPVENLQKMLSSINFGPTVHKDDVNNNNKFTEQEPSEISTSPNRIKSKVVGVQNIGSPLNNLGKDIARGFSILQNQLTQSNIMSPLAELVDRDARRKHPMQQQQLDDRPRAQTEQGVLREIGLTPTIATLPPLEVEDSKARVVKEYQLQPDALSFPGSVSDCSDEAERFDDFGKQENLSYELIEDLSRDAPGSVDKRVEEELAQEDAGTTANLT
jgi:hypothetical protein